MRKLFFTSISFFIVQTMLGQNHFSVELQNYYRKLKEYSPSGFLWATRKFEGKNYGVYSYALASSGYGELQIGRSQIFRSGHPGKFVEIGTSIGLETDDHPLRGGVFIYFNNNRDSTGKRQTGKWKGAIALELGGSGFWYYGIITCNISEKVAVGAQAQALAGVWGPRLEYQSGPFVFYIAGGYSLETKEPGAINGVRVHF